MQPVDAVAAAIDISRVPLAALSLAFARVFGLLAILPISTRLGLQNLPRAGVALALAMFIAPALVVPLRQAAPSGGFVILLATKEAFVGFFIGVLFAAPFWAAETAGELVDQQRGSRGATIPDPAQEEQAGITATLLVLCLVTVFFMQGGMGLLLDAITASYAAWPVGDIIPNFAPDAALRVLAMMDQVLRAGLILSAPLLCAMILAELALALVSKFAQPLNVFDLAMSVKGLVHVIGLPLYVVVLIAYMRDGLAPLARFGDVLRSVSGH